MNPFWGNWDEFYDDDEEVCVGRGSLTSSRWSKKMGDGMFCPACRQVGFYSWIEFGGHCVKCKLKYKSANKQKGI
jgi:hypothetical protein